MAYYIDEEEKRRIAEIIRSYVTKRRITQQHVSDVSGVNRAHVNRILNGHVTGHSLQKIIEMAKAVGLVVQVSVREPEAIDG